MSSERLVLTGAAVVSVDTLEVINGRSLLIEDDTIVVIQADEELAGCDAETVVLHGQHVIPGLIDAHVHFYKGQRDVNTRFAEAFINAGVTSVLCLNGSPDIQELAADTAAGRIVGPRIFSSGPILDDPDMTYEEAYGESVSEAAEGYDFVKVYNELTVEAYQGIVDGAAAAGIRVLGHVTRAPGLDGVLASAQVAIAHAEELLYTAFDYSNAERWDWGRNPPLHVAAIPELVERVRRAGVSVIATLEAYKAIRGQSEDPEAWFSSASMEQIPESVISEWRRPDNKAGYQVRFVAPHSRRNLLESYWFQVRLIEALARAGVPLPLGTDAGLPGVPPGLSLHAELVNLSVAGLGDAGALRSATIEAGRLIDPEGKLGTLEAGAAADLVVARDNPLEDVRHLRHPYGVVSRGHWTLLDKQG